LYVVKHDLPLVANGGIEAPSGTRDGFVGRLAMNQLAEGKEPVKHTPIDRGPWEERLMTAYEKNPLHQL